jgi:hypothetical protein
MKPGVMMPWISGVLPAVVAGVTSYLAGIHPIVAVFVGLLAGVMIDKIVRPDSAPKYRGGTGFDDYDGGHDSGHGGDHGGDHGGGAD